MKCDIISCYTFLLINCEFLSVPLIYGVNNLRINLYSLSVISLLYVGKKFNKWKTVQDFDMTTY